MAGLHNVLQSYADPRATALQGIAASMDPAQKYLLAMAHRISPAQLGLTPQQTNYYEQGLTGVTMNPRTGQIINNNTGQAVDPSSLMSTANTNMGGNIAGSGGVTPTPGYNMTGTVGTGQMAGGGYLPGYTPPAGTGYGTSGGVSNIGGGAGNPNNAAGGLYGAAGNQVRQQMMDSQQFNPNGANTYAIQNMNLSGQGDLGSNMGGMASNNTNAYPSQTTAVGNGSTSGAVMPSTSYSTTTSPSVGTGAMTQQTSPYSTAGTAPTSTTPSYFPKTNSVYGSGLASQQGLTR